MEKKIQDLIQETMKGLKKREKKENNFDILKEVVGPQWESEINFLSYDKGLLKVGVLSSAALQEMTQFYKYQWLKEMKDRGSRVKEIRFYLIDEFLGE